MKIPEIVSELRSHEYDWPIVAQIAADELERLGREVEKSEFEIIQLSNLASAQKDELERLGREVQSLNDQRLESGRKNKKLYEENEKVESHDLKDEKDTLLRTITDLRIQLDEAEGSE